LGGNQLRLVDVGEMAAVVQLHDPIAEQGEGSTFLGGPQNPILGPPKHIDGLEWQGMATAGKAAGAGELP